MYRSPYFGPPIARKSPHRRGDVPRQNVFAVSILQSPHRRGDVPRRIGQIERRRAISPQAWGCTGKNGILNMALFNLPTGVGMYRGALQDFTWGDQSPHRRGDVPVFLRGLANICQISPQAWGCTDSNNSVDNKAKNLPTGVGMYRFHVCVAGSAKKSPHRRGDVPYLNAMKNNAHLISPQAWGCTVMDMMEWNKRGNLPTGVGMYRT